MDERFWCLKCMKCLEVDEFYYDDFEGVLKHSECRGPVAKMDLEAGRAICKKVERLQDAYTELRNAASWFLAKIEISLSDVLNNSETYKAQQKLVELLKKEFTP